MRSSTMVNLEFLNQCSGNNLQKASTRASWLIIGNATPVGSAWIPCSKATVRLHLPSTPRLAGSPSGVVASKNSPIKMSASRNWSMGQSQASISPASSGSASQSGDVLIVDDVPGRPLACLAVVARCPRGSPFGSGQAVVEDSVLFSIMTLVASMVTPVVQLAMIPSGRVTASGAIAHSLMAWGSMSSQCSRRPTERKVGILGTCSWARPLRTAHQLADTAMAKANTAVYSASSLEG